MMRDILITSSVLICAILLIRILFRKALSRRAQYALWLLVAVRLLLPVNLPALGHNVLTAAQPVQEAVAEAGERPAGTVRYDTLTLEEFRESQPTFDWANMPVEEGNGTFSEVAQPWRDPNVEGTTYAALSREGDSVNLYQRLTVTDILIRVWYVGMALMGAWFLLANLLFYFRLCKTRRLLNVADSQRKVFVTDAIPSPCLFGLLWPAIYLTPQAAEDPVARRYAVLHEETHARHWDPLWSLVRGVCLVIYWFDPLVWVAAHVSKIDCELACDEGVLSRLPDTERIPYGQTLVSLIPVKKLGASPLLSATTMTAGKKQMKDRITRIAQNKKPLLWALAVVAVLAVVICAVTFTGASNRHADPEPSPVESISTETPAPTPDSSLSAGAVPFDNIMGLSGYYVDDLSGDIPRRDYYGYLPDGSAVRIAYCNGTIEECWVRDLDGDGVTELICNTQPDTRKEVKVFCRAGNAVLIGYLNSYNLEITDWDDTEGVLSWWTEYDPNQEVFVFHYATKETEGHVFNERTTASLRDFVFEEYADLWPTVDLFAVEGPEVAAYQELLRQFINDLKQNGIAYLPGMKDGRYVADGYGSDRFAICDIDRDGAQELLLQHTSTSMAGMEEYVFRYDPAAGKVALQGSFFPKVNYFDNGCLKEGWSHNQQSSPVWPYYLWRYDADRDSYQEEAFVTGRNMDGGPVYAPSDIVEDPTHGEAPWYAVSTPAEGDEWDPEIMTGLEYTRWTEGIFRNARELLPPWQDLTLENIDGYPLRSAPLSAGNTAPSFSRDGVSFHRYYGDGWYIDVPDRWGENLHGMSWTAPTSTASITVSHSDYNTRNTKASYAQDSWPGETDMPAPFDLYYDFGHHDPTWGIKYELYFVPESNSSSFVLQCAGDWGEAAREDWDMLHTILQTFTVDDSAHPVTTDRYVAGESEMAVVLDALADPNTTVYMGLSRDGYAFGYTDPAWERSPLSAGYAARLADFAYTDFAPRGIDPSPQEHWGADDVAFVLGDLGCTLTFYKGSNIISLYYQGESFYATASHPDGLTPYEVAYDWYIALAGHPTRSSGEGLDRAKEALEQNGANEITGVYLDRVDGDHIAAYSSLALELIRSQADHLMEDSEQYSSRGTPVYLTSQAGTLALTRTDVPGLVRIYGDLRAYGFSAVTESPELELLLAAWEENGAMDTVDLDGDGSYEYLVWPWNDDNLKKLIIYSLVDGKVNRLDVNEALGCDAASWMGNAANAPEQYRNAIYGVWRNGDRTEYYNYDHGELDPIPRP